MSRSILVVGMVLALFGCQSNEPERHSCYDHRSPMVGVNVTGRSVDVNVRTDDDDDDVDVHVTWP